MFAVHREPVLNAFVVLPLFFVHQFSAESVNESAFLVLDLIRRSDKAFPTKRISGQLGEDRNGLSLKDSAAMRYADEPAQGCSTPTWPTALTNAVTSGCRLPSNARRSG
jgi:hypothetical protein